MGDKHDLTARENEVLALAWQCFEVEPKVDMKKLAALTGYTTGSAAFTMGKIKRKLKNKTAGITKDNPTPKKSQGRPRTSKTSIKRSASEDSDGNEAVKTPSKKCKTAAKKRLEEAFDDDDDEDIMATPIKKEEKINHGYSGPMDFYAQAMDAAGYGLSYKQ